MYVDAVGTLPPVGMSMLSVQIIPPSFGIAHLSFGLSARSWTTSPDHATDAANVPVVSGCAKSFPVKRTTCPESTAACTRSIAALKLSSVTAPGSSPFASITRPTESASS